MLLKAHVHTPHRYPKRQRQRHTDRQSHTQTDTETQRDTDIQTETHRGTDRQTETHRRAVPALPTYLSTSTFP